jgi:hypothetical protein
MLSKIALFLGKEGNNKDSNVRSAILHCFVYRVFHNFSGYPPVSSAWRRSAFRHGGEEPQGMPLWRYAADLPDCVRDGYSSRRLMGVTCSAIIFSASARVMCLRLSAKPRPYGSGWPTGCCVFSISGDPPPSSPAYPPCARWPRRPESSRSMPTMIKQQRCHHLVRIVVVPVVVVVVSYAGKKPKTENNRECERASNSSNPRVELV